MSRKYFGTDGIRGRVGQSPISADFVLRLGNAYGHALWKGREGTRKPLVVIGKDTRISNYMFEAALEAGLVAAGVNVQLMGPMPTPAVAHLTRSLRADGGIVISASHNPHHDNGIKFFSHEGEKLDDATELAIEAALEQPFSTVESEWLARPCAPAMRWAGTWRPARTRCRAASISTACTWPWTAPTAPPTRWARWCCVNWVRG